MRRSVALVALLLLLAAVAAPAAWAEEGAQEAAKDGTNLDHVFGLLAVLLVGVIVFAGIGASMAVLRVVLPGLARAVDQSVEGLSTGRMLLTGILPLVGAWLLGAAVHHAGDRTLVGAYALVVLLPLCLLTVTGALAAIPHLGARLLARGEDVSPLRRSLVGGLVVGLAGTTWVLPPLGALVSLFLFGWFLGIGLSTVFRPREPARA